MSGGKRHHESTRKRDKEEAQGVLSIKLGDIAKGVPVTAEIGKKTLAQGLQAVVDDLSINGRQSAKEVKRQIELHILTYFPKNRRMSEITTSQLSAFVKHRKDEGTASASCNGDLAIIRRAYKLARRAGELLSEPYYPMLSLNNARQGFFEQHELDAVLQHLPEWAQAPVEFAYITGWRVQSEVLPLTVAQVDMKAETVRLEVGTTKNKDGRTFMFTPELRKLLKVQLAALEKLKEAGTISPYVFHKPGGSRITNLREAWETAREQAGYPAKLLHDLRRTAVRTSNGPPACPDRRPAEDGWTQNRRCIAGMRSGRSHAARSREVRGMDRRTESQGQCGTQGPASPLQKVSVRFSVGFSQIGPAATAADSFQ